LVFRRLEVALGLTSSSRELQAAIVTLCSMDH